uniref:Cyclin n=1 Tax=Lotharella oceanica TaxID=641309 RepID=A0A7S2TZ04_9EUKA|mmetsp:Transcript_36412/g.67283  ORF Transcript_36412/g.67283 Transcript_36412/m.67283 type:complete len:223 (+) Transcript_36412:87-755(+)|eukprot:CAMPEP_0170176730 /NCGR_PEP_ID=MMETSP0040_2-20121228/9534_1 /TAXON_ID=641309 /ORGANISM="Lotharella oceanica, Strain CCMP622" /LENGTH=222 /DNA_ID=CAMNT_0010419147 /DNA_START=99 /DNA_END=767 /DNA_ORIENTATION=+
MDTRPDKTGKAIVPVLACVLNQLCARNDQLSLDPKYVSKFHALRPPGITIRDYLERIAKYAACSGECFVLALVYIDRIIQSNPNFVVNSLNIHRLLITSVMISAKFFDDQYFNNAYYAKVGGVPCKEMNSLEVEFLFLTNFSLFVTYDTYKQYHTELRNHAMHSSCDCNPYRVPELEGEKEGSTAKEEKSKDVIMMQTESVPRPTENHSQQQGTAMMASTPY